MASFKTFDIDQAFTPSSQVFVPCMIIVQARMMSTRLPGKVMQQILGKPMLFYLIERLRSVTSCHGIIVATSHNPKDDAIVNFCNQESLHCIRGSEEDVLSRFYAAAEAFGLETVVRICSDCPLIDPTIIERGLQCFQSKPDNFDYLSNTLLRTFPRGMDFEIFQVKALKQAFFEASSLYDKEHVTPFITKHPEQFRLANIGQKEDQSDLRLTVDTPEDFELIRRLFEELYPTNNQFTLKDIYAVLKEHTDWPLLNAHIVQKSG